MGASIKDVRIFGVFSSYFSNTCIDLSLVFYENPFLTLIFKSSWAQAFVLGLDCSPDLNTVNVFAKSKCGLIPIVPRCFARPV
jgi:hypothetical protein